ncbi:MAG: cell division protein FtsZ [Candidatus Woesearchaeota archaeon]|nr:MAG: cell division protein FtsZ [Candidatus Woesearchaeota archaeon]
MSAFYDEEDDYEGVLGSEKEDSKEEDSHIKSEDTFEGKDPFEEKDPISELSKSIVPPSTKVSSKEIGLVDQELEEIISKIETRIKVVGTGGAGNNTVSRISEMGVLGAETIAVNTDAQDLLKAKSSKKILIGRDVTGGLGAGSDPGIGREAAKESEQDIKQAVKGAQMVFLTCGLGGGTGTGSIPILAEITKKLGILTVAIVTLPFTIEGQKRLDNAQDGLERLEGLVDTLIVIPNDKLLELAPDLPLSTSFKVADEILTNAVKGIAELVTKPGLINLDFADIRAVMGEGGIAMIGIGESDTESRAEEAVEKAINNPLLDVEIPGANGALINVLGGEDMTLDEAKKVVETVSTKLSDDAKIIWGAQLSPDLKNSIRAMLIITGVKSPQIFGKGMSFMDKRREEISGDLGIEFVD